MSNSILIGSCESFSGKSAIVLGLARNLITSKKKVRIGKPLATCLELAEEKLDQEKRIIDDDMRFIASTLQMNENDLIPSVSFFSEQTTDKRIFDKDLEPEKTFDDFINKINDGFIGLNILEAGGSLNEGLIYGLSLGQLANKLNCKVLLVNLWEDSRSIDYILTAKAILGDNLLGIVLNSVNPLKIEEINSEIKPSIESMGIKVFGIMPKSPLLRSVSVRELVRRLHAEIICCEDKDELLVETLSIGAMGVNSAMEFFRRRRNMAVVTGADRTDIQFAALEASTQCLILTGLGEPTLAIIHRAEELDVPILKVDKDTLSTVEIIEHAFGHVRLHESIKASYAVRLVEENVDIQAIFNEINFSSDLTGIN
tara:strand:- start:7183 stop:8292 length:1110 start_codon:yes stop_codon:yes gene_type:complete